MPLAWSTWLVMLTAAQADWPAGADIEGAVFVDVTLDGLRTVEDVVARFVPESVDVPDMEDGAAGPLGNVYGYKLEDLAIDLALNDIAIDPVPDDPGTSVVDESGLLISIRMRVQAGSSAQPILGTVQAGFLGSLTCGIWTDPIDVEATAIARLELLGNGSARLFDVTIPDPEYDILLDGASFNSSGCGIGTFIEWVDVAMDFLGASGGLTGLILDAVEPQIDNALGDLTPELETTIEGALSALQMDTSFDVGGKPVDLAMEPADLEIVDDGLRIEMMASTDVKSPDPCVAPYDSGLSLQTFAGLPELGHGPQGMRHHAGVMVNDDFVNQLMYAVWRSGILCYEIADGTLPIELPLRLDTGILSLFSRGGFDHVYPEPGKLIMHVRPFEPPVARTDGVYDVDIAVKGLALDMYGHAQGRMFRAIGLEAGADAGLDVGFDGASGLLQMLVHFSASDIALFEVYNELAPDSGQSVVDGLATIIDSVATPLIADSLGGLQFPLPSFGELGVVELDVQGSGPGGDFLGAFARLGLVDEGYGEMEGGGGCGGEGCGGETGGCEMPDDGGCGGDLGAGDAASCNVTRIPGRAMLFVVPLLVGGLRRRPRTPRP